MDASMEYADMNLDDFSDIFSNESESGTAEPAAKKLKTVTRAPASGSAEEKKQLERERNRQHARNTRERKKKYADELTQKLAQLTEEKEAALAAESEAIAKKTEQQTAWTSVLRKAMDLRAQGVLDEEQWSTLLAEDFKLTMPVTPYRSFSPADIFNNRRVLLGVDGMISDTASLAVMCDNIGIKSRKNEGRTKIEYLLGSDTSDNCFFGAAGFMCTFMMRTIDAKAHGALCEIEKSGLMRARFTEDSATPLLEELEITFDNISVYHQLMRAKGEKNFPLVPNTLSTVLKNQKDRIVVTTASRPFCITHVNDAWTQLCGYELDECKGKNLSILQGDETDMATVAKLVDCSQKGYPASMIVTNYSKEGRAFRNHLNCLPLYDENGEITNIVGILDEIRAQ